MLRWIFRTFLVIIDLLLWETGLVGIPNSIIGQTRYLNALDDYILLRALAIVLALIVALLAVGPTRLKEWRRIIAARGLGMGEHRNDEESGRYVDNRSVSSSGQVGGQTAWSITNEGPQPREISQSAGDALARELQKHAPEEFLVTPMTDPESSELSAVLRQLLVQGGWQSVEYSKSFHAFSTTPQGVIIETDLETEGVAALIQWMRSVQLQPKVNRGDQKEFVWFARGGFGDGPIPPVYIMVGVLPR